MAVTVVKYEWDFGDGATSQEQNPNHTYRMAGQYEVILVMTLSDGSQYYGTETVYVYDWDYTDDRYNVAVTDDAMRYAYRSKQGVGWSFFGGDDWVWPEARHGSLRLVDTTGELIQIVFDARTGLPYRIDRDVWSDKKDGSYVGTEIETECRFKEDRGSAEHYFIESTEQHIHTRPYDEDLRGSSGHDAQGYRDNFTLGVGLLADGEQNTPAAYSQEVPIDGDIVHDRRVEAHRLQPYFTTSTSEYKVVRRRSYYIAKDRAAPPSKRTMSEMDWQGSLSDVSLWLSRGPNLILNRATGDDMNGTILAACNGPDGDNVSAMLFNGAEGLWDTPADLTGDFTVLFWLAQVGGNVDVFQFATGTGLIRVSPTEIRFTDATNAYGADFTWDQEANPWRLFGVRRDGGFVGFWVDDSIADTDVIGTYNTYGGRTDIMLNQVGRLAFPRIVPSALTNEVISYYRTDILDNSANATEAIA